MRDDERAFEVRRLLFDYVKSPSLRHIRDPHSISKLAQEIVRCVDQGNSIWRKWDGQREALPGSALGCWVPVEDLHYFLNQMPGPALTKMDVAQRLRALEDERCEFENEEFRAGCLVIFEREKAEGTDLPAIVQLLRDHIEREEDRLLAERQERYQRIREEEQIAREQRLVAGADCGWTQLRKSRHWYCRMNGRTYRLTPTSDKKRQLYRVEAISDSDEGALIGTYQGRADATKVIKQMAYQPEPRWR